jgi:S-adenosylmethionine hydrolase
MKVNSIITLTTDFGISDPFVGMMKGELGIKKGEKVVIKIKN